MKNLIRVLVPLVFTVALVSVAGCGKKSAPPPPEVTAPPTTAPATAPTAKITATPNVVSAGDQVQLAWRTTDATSVSIDGIGTVPTSGVKSVSPTTSITYHLVARGEGGSTDESVRVTVNPPPAVVVPVNPVGAGQAEEAGGSFKSSVQDIFFDYDTYDIRADAMSTLSHDAAYLGSHPDVKIVIGGYCDERGSNEYNLSLGQSRADAAKNALISAGVAASRIRVVSYGKEKPFCTESTEQCWQLNRRGGFTEER
jgi:peptidoglycan-associated lipoprotein